MPFNRRGVVLVEVLIAALLAAVIISGVFGTALSSLQMIERTGSRTQANAAAKRLSDMLGNYTAADPFAGAGIPVAFAPNNCWNIAASGCPAGWALSDGNHLNAGDFLLPSDMQPGAIAYPAHMSYSVCSCGAGAVVPCAAASCPAAAPPGSKQITITTTWTEPP